MESEKAEETKEELIERLLAKAELDYKCSGGHCSGFWEPPGAQDHED
jgi:hypothetical protein